MGGLTCRARPQHPPPLDPQSTPICGNIDQPIWAPMAPTKLFGPLVKGLENWFHPICFSPKCTDFNGEFKSFHFPPPPWPRLCRHMDFSPLWGPREGRGLCSHIDLPSLWGNRQGRGLVAILISPHSGPLEGRGDVAIIPHYGDHGVGQKRKNRKHLWGGKNAQG